MKWTYRSEYVRCGNERCGSCPHGPYWYRYRKEKGKLKKEYCGKDDPFVGARQPKQDEQRHPHDIIHNLREASSSLACEILGLPTNVSFEVAKATARRLLMENHPDRGGDNALFCRLNSAWTFLKVAKGWK